jgi:hypothetical protein
VTDEYSRAKNNNLPIVQPLKDQSWGHRSFCVREPNGLTLYLFNEIGRGAGGTAPAAPFPGG